jgi:hypothetical protein
MPATESNRIHHELNFNLGSVDCTCHYAVAPEVLRTLETWFAHRQLPRNTVQLVYLDWFLTHGARLDRIDGPAFVMLHTNGNRSEAYCRDGKLDRTDGPALVTTWSDGTRWDEWYHDDKLDRADGPARVRPRPDGSRNEDYFRDGKFIKGEYIPAPTASPGVNIKASPRGPAL